MTGLIVSLSLIAYTVVSFVIARRAYRAEYAKVYGAPAPRSYGGKIGHGRAHEVAIREGVEWLLLWPAFVAWAVFYRLISGPMPVQARLDEMQAEVDKLAAQQDEGRDWANEPGPVKLPEKKTCPCGYTDECRIHCGDGSLCHRVMVQAKDQVEYHAVRHAFHPAKASNPEQGREITWTDPGAVIRTPHPQHVFSNGEWIMAPGTGTCRCTKCQAEELRRDDVEGPW